MTNEQAISELITQQKIVTVALEEMHKWILHLEQRIDVLEATCRTKVDKVEE